MSLGKLFTVMSNWTMSSSIVPISLESNCAILENPFKRALWWSDAMSGYPTVLPRYWILNQRVPTGGTK